MITDRYTPERYRCSCGQVSKHYVWTSKMEGAIHSCPQCKMGLTIEHLDIEEINEAPRVGKMTRDQIKADRKQRAQNHFKREVLPTLGKMERKHFGKKFGKNYL